MVCADCLENGNSYSREDYLGRGFDPAASEYQQLPMTQHYLHPHPHPHQHTHPHHAGQQEALCNGTPNGIRRDAQATTFPRNHGTSQHNHSDREGKGMMKARRMIDLSFSRSGGRYRRLCIVMQGLL